MNTVVLHLSNYILNFRMTGQINKVSPHGGRSWKNRGVWEFTDKFTFVTLLLIKYYNITFYFIYKRRYLYFIVLMLQMLY